MRKRTNRRKISVCGKEHITARIDPEDVRRLEEMTADLGMNQSAVIRICIRYTYKDLDAILTKI